MSSIDVNAVTNPTFLVEVTSVSTEDEGRGDKLRHYKQIPTLHAVLFVSHRRRSITVVERTAEGWAEREVCGGERVTMQTPNLAFEVDDVYEGITLEPG